MKVTIKRITDWSVVLDDARFTMNMSGLDKEPSDNFKHSILRAEHSPIRDLRFIIEIEDIPCWVAQHISRHDAFAGHYMRDGEKEQYFIGTSRTDRTGVNRNELPQDHPVNMRISASAADLIAISRKRLCKKASKETREVWREVVQKMHELDPIVAKYLVPECVYRNFCPEKDSCGAVHASAFKDIVKHYQEIPCPE